MWEKIRLEPVEKFRAMSYRDTASEESLNNFAEFE